SRSFLEQGHLVVPAEDAGALDRIRSFIVDRAASELAVETVDDPQAFLDGIHERVSPLELNRLRLTLINELNRQPWLRVTYFRLAQRTLSTLVGNELAMQRRVNLSIQMPDDDSSLLPVHADVWDGDSPFEVVLWVPLVDR